MQYARCPGGRLRLPVVVAALALGCGPAYDGAAQPSVPRHHIARWQGRLFLVESDSVASCLAGLGDARLLPITGGDLPPGWFHGECQQLTLAHPQDLLEPLARAGFTRDPGTPLATASPLIAEGGHHGYVQVGRDSDGREAYLRYSESRLRVVIWSAGNRWGIEEAHEYEVSATASGLVPVTVRADHRRVALEPNPRVVTGWLPSGIAPDKVR